MNLSRLKGPAAMLTWLTTLPGVGIVANMDAVLILMKKERRDGGYIQEYVIWQVPEPVHGSSHRFKYRLFFGRAGVRIIGFDNERGKGDHKHVEGREIAYSFTDIASLVDDFENEVTEWLNNAS